MALKNKHTLLLVDDERAITRALKRLFRKQGYGIMTAESGSEGLELLKKTEAPVSMIISDQRMPEMNGTQFLEKAKSIFPNAVRYLLTGYADMDAVIQAVNKGEIHRYLAKPWHDDDLLLQVRQSLEHYELASENQQLSALTIAQNKKLRELTQTLEGKVKEHTREIVEKHNAQQKINRMLEQSFMDTIHLLVSLVETLNPGLGNQMRQVAQIARQTADMLDLPKDDLDKIEMAGMMHDIGLIGLEDNLWCKEIEHMSDAQSRAFNEHPVIAYIILGNVEKLADVGQIVLCHHEHMNGQGFPSGLRKGDIPIGSRILLAASDYCRIVTTWPRDLQKLTAYTRTHFDTDVLKRLTVSEGPQTIIEAVAEQVLLLGLNQKYDLAVVTALLKAIRKSKQIDPAHDIPLAEIEAGMVLMEDLRMNDGRLLLNKGTRLKATAVQSIQAISERGLIPTHVVVSATEGPADEN